MALSWASLGTTYTSGTTPSLIFSSTPNSGDIIVVAINTRETTQTMTTAPSGYTPGPSSTGTNFNAFIYWKVSDGTETSVGCTLGASSNLRISAVVLQGASGTLSLDDSDSDASNVGTATTSGGFGSVTTTENNAGVCAILFMDQSWGAVTEPTVSSYTNTNNDPVSSNHGGIDMFTRVLSATGTETPTWSASGDIDQNFGVLLAFKDTVAGGNTISVPVGSLTLTGFAPTVVATANQLIAVPSGSLSLTGFAPSVLNGANQVIQVPVGSIVLTGYVPTVVSTANQTIAVPAGSLVITGYAPTVRVGNDQIVVVPAGSLTLTGYAPTIVTTNNKFISVPVGTLILTGYAPTVIGGEVTTKGGRGWTESERRLNERLRRLALQQARWEDDEEALAILLASIIRR